MTRCPACGSAELSGPSNSDPYNLCADCGHSWPLPGLEDVYEEIMARYDEEESMNHHLTVAVASRLGAAFGLWAREMDVATRGRPQEGNPDLVAVEETPAYAAVLKAIEEQEGPTTARTEVAGMAVYAETAPSPLYLAMREAMFKAYRSR